MCVVQKVCSYAGILFDFILITHAYVCLSGYNLASTTLYDCAAIIIFAGAIGASG